MSDSFVAYFTNCGQLHDLLKCKGPASTDSLISVLAGNAIVSVYTILFGDIGTGDAQNWTRERLSCLRVCVCAAYMTSENIAKFVTVS